MGALDDRVRQFREAGQQPAPADYAFARKLLPRDELYELFVLQEPRDIVHAVRTARWLIDRNERDPELLMAALLHDIGKGHQRTRDRVGWVLAGTLGIGERFAAHESRLAIRRAAARSAEHAAAGAEMLRRAGAPPLVIELTLLHHDPHAANGMLKLLQAADAAS